MVHKGHGQPQIKDVVSSTSQPTYATNIYEAEKMMGNPGQESFVASIGARESAVQAAGTKLSEQCIAYQQMIQQKEVVLQQHLQSFWAHQHEEIQKISEFRNHSLPLARIKRIMKADEDVRMISAEAPVVFAKACEMFILELTLRAWYHTEEGKRRTLQRNDIASAIAKTEIYDFLVDIIPVEGQKDEALSSMPRNATPVNAVADSQAYYYLPAQQSSHARTLGMNTSVPVMDPSLYTQFNPYMAPHLWPQAPKQSQSPSDSQQPK